MSDVLERKARFRLKRDAYNWKLEKSYFSKEEGGGSKWKADSYHPKLGPAFRYLMDRLVAEGYETKGLAALMERLEQAEARVTELAGKIEAGEEPAEVEGL